MSQHQHDRDDENASPPELVRWSEERAQTGMAREDGARSSSAPAETLEQRVGALFRILPEPPALGPVAQSRVLARLRAPGRRPWFRPLVMGGSLGAVLWLLSGAVIAAGGVGTWWKLAHPKPAEVAPAPPRSEAAAGTGRIRSGQRRAGRARLAPDTTAKEDQQPAPVDAPEAPAGQPVAPAPQEAAPTQSALHELPAASLRPPSLLALVDKPRASRTRPAPPAAFSGLGQETRVLANAMAHLRRDEDAGAALVALDGYLRQFPDGMLIDEARRARVDALLMLDRKDDARRALDELELETEGRGLELRLIRGELRARNSCWQASQDFDAVLLHAPPPQIAERALFGRAVCRNRQGQNQGARADARTYLERFPAGRFAAAVRRIASGASVPAP